jgi:hypothetical protein
MGLHGGTGCAGSIHHAEMREVRASPYILVFGVSDEEKSIMFAAQNIRVLIQRYGIARNGNLGILGGEEGEIRIERIRFRNGINLTGQRVWKNDYSSTGPDSERWRHANVLDFKRYHRDFSPLKGHVLFSDDRDIGSQLSLLHIASGHSVPSSEECCSRQQIEGRVSKWVFVAGATICCTGLWLGIFVFPPHRMDRQLIGVALFVAGWLVMALSGDIGFRLSETPGRSNEVLVYPALVNRNHFPNLVKNRSKSRDRSRSGRRKPSARRPSLYERGPYCARRAPPRS